MRHASFATAAAQDLIPMTLDKVFQLVDCLDRGSCSYPSRLQTLGARGGHSDDTAHVGELF